MSDCQKLSEQQKQRVVIASANQGKLKEFQQLFSNCAFSAVPQSDFQVSSVAETGLSFVENAIIKARHAAEQTGLPAIADDSGIEVDALQGAPGIYSARFSGEGACDQDNNRHLLQALEGVDEARRSARYQCVLVMLRHSKDPTPLICQGTWEGSITDKARGDNGFGYDSLFFIPSHSCTAAELDPHLKNVISHRGRAMARLFQALS